MDEATPAGAAGDEGVDFDWLLTRGADMTWLYGFEVQSSLTDIEAAYAAEDWPTCVASCTLTLRTLADCTYRGAGISTATESEMQLRLAGDTSVVAQAYRSLPLVADAGKEAAEAAMAAVEKCDAWVQGLLPWTVPLLRSPSGSRQSTRLSASIVKWRKIRGIGNKSS
jgi:hypothetical protein